MAEQVGAQKVARYLPHVLVATLLVLVLPSIVVYVLERLGLLSSPLLSMVAALVISIAVAQGMGAAWMRHSGSRDLVFGDLMLWGWWRRLRTENRLSDAIHLLGLDRAGKSRGEVFMSPQRQAEVLTELASVLEAGDPFTHGHSKRVTRYSHMIAKTMHLPAETVDKIRSAAAVHDVGKIDTPSSILNKPGSLTDAEYDIMKQHPVTGAAMAERLGDIEITAIVRHHHERIDGRGYPDALSGEEIPLGARVIAVADTFDAITSARPYRKGKSHREAIEIIKRASGTQLDPDVVDAFLVYYSGKKALTLWMSLSTALQRIVGGFGDWVQHAHASGLSSGAASIGVAVTITAVAAGVIPAAAAPRHGVHRTAVSSHQAAPRAVVANLDPARSADWASREEAGRHRDGKAGSKKKRHPHRARVHRHDPTDLVAVETVSTSPNPSATDAPATQHHAGGGPAPSRESGGGDHHQPSTQPPAVHQPTHRPTPGTSGDDPPSVDPSGGDPHKGDDGGKDQTDGEKPPKDKKDDGSGDPHKDDGGDHSGGGDGSGDDSSGGGD
jgi:putative nucleotidyltransferase with HDIG domain